MVPAACKALPHRSRDPRPAPSTLDRRPPTAARAARAPCCRATDGPARSLRWTAARASPQPSPHGKVRGSLAAGSLVLAVGNSVGTVAIVQFEPTKRQPSPDGAPGLVLDTLVSLCIYLLGAKRFRFLRVSAKSRVSDFAMAVGVGAGWHAREVRRVISAPMPHPWTVSRTAAATDRQKDWRVVARLRGAALALGGGALVLAVGTVK